MDLRELLRHLQATTNVSVIQRATGLNRRTIARYRTWAHAQGLLEKPLPVLRNKSILMALDVAAAGSDNRQDDNLEFRREP